MEKLTTVSNGKYDLNHKEFAVVVVTSFFSGVSGLLSFFFYSLASISSFSFSLLFCFFFSKLDFKSLICLADELVLKTQDYLIFLQRKPGILLRWKDP